MRTIIGSPAHVLSAVNGLSRLTKLLESANPFRIESNRKADSNSNRISKLRRSLVLRVHAVNMTSHKIPNGYGNNDETLFESLFS